MVAHWSGAVIYWDIRYHDHEQKLVHQTFAFCYPSSIEENITPFSNPDRKHPHRRNFARILFEIKTLLSRRVQSPYPRRTPPPPSLFPSSAPMFPARVLLLLGWILNVPSCFFSSAVSAAPVAAPPEGAPPPTAGAPPPEPTAMSRSLTSLPSRALAKREAQIGSQSTLAALIRLVILSACMTNHSSAAVPPFLILLILPPYLSWPSTAEYRMMKSKKNPAAIV